MSTRTNLLLASLFLAIIFTLLQISAHYFYFYWIYWWFDWVMHFLAGVTGGIAGYWVLYYGEFFENRSDKVFVLTMSVLSCVMFSGVVWEILEYVLGLTQAHENMYVQDVFNDFVSNAAGAFLGIFISLKATIYRNV
ncbi:MAG: hypothetical protein NUV78_03450 [Candidatus Zambryskibacteria bacterium]|nr:hypothetical protein [Candidatus Zambryskibacteria bacterium]